jgi:hypothetical protein
VNGKSRRPKAVSRTVIADHGFALWGRRTKAAQNITTDVRAQRGEIARTPGA